MGSSSSKVFGSDVDELWRRCECVPDVVMDCTRYLERHLAEPNLFQLPPCNLLGKVSPRRPLRSRQRARGGGSGGLTPPAAQRGR